LLQPPQNNLAIDLKTDFFHYAPYRLAGGMDNSVLGDGQKNLEVETESFTIQVKKISAANMIKKSMKFYLEDSQMQENMDQKGSLAVEIPADRSIFEK